MRPEADVMEYLVDTKTEQFSHTPSPDSTRMRYRTARRGFLQGGHASHAAQGHPVRIRQV